MDNNINQLIYNSILNRIITLEYKPGQIIEEKKIADEFKVSRTPVREALLKLSSNSMIEMIPRIGTYVSQIDIKAVKNAYQIRKKLESFATELCIQNITDENSKKLVEIASKMDKYNKNTDYKKYIDDDYQFFKIIRESTRNEKLIDILDDLNNITVRFLRYIQYVNDNPKWHTQHLVEIANLIRNKDSETASNKTEYFIAVYVKKVFNTYFG